MRLRQVHIIIIWGEISEHYRWRQLNYRLLPRKAMNWPRIWDPKQMEGLLRTHDLQNGEIAQGLRGAEQDVLSEWLRFLSTRLWYSVSPTFIHAASEVRRRQKSARLSGSMNRLKEAACKICNLSPGLEQELCDSDCHCGVFLVFWGAGFLFGRELYTVKTRYSKYSVQAHSWDTENVFL